MASHNPYAPLEALPTEILQMILSQMACTQDLSAAIRASPTILHSFLGQREEILIRVIQSTLDPKIFTVVLGLLDVPNFKGLHYVPTPNDAHSHRLDIIRAREDYGEDDLCIWWWLCRWNEMDRLTRDFQMDHLEILRKAMKPGAPQPFPVPRIRRPVDQEQLAQFRRRVNTVAEIFGSLKRHMEQSTCIWSQARFRDLWFPATASSYEFAARLYSHGEEVREISLVEQEAFLWNLLKKKMQF